MGKGWRGERENCERWTPTKDWHRARVGGRGAESARGYWSGRRKDKKNKKKTTAETLTAKIQAKVRKQEKKKTERPLAKEVKEKAREDKEQENVNASEKNTK